MTHFKNALCRRPPASVDNLNFFNPRQCAQQGYDLSVYAITDPGYVYHVVAFPLRNHSGNCSSRSTTTTPNRVKPTESPAMLPLSSYTVSSVTRKTIGACAGKIHLHKVLANGQVGTHSTARVLARDLNRPVYAVVRMAPFTLPIVPN